MSKTSVHPHAHANGQAKQAEDMWRIHFVQILICTTILRLLFAVCAELKYEEAYYWLYGQHLSLSYFDHPPMVGWLIALFTGVGGQLELMVRLPAIALFAATLTLLFVLASRMYNTKVGFITAGIACCLPSFEWYSMFMLPDAPLLFCWTLGLVSGYKLLSEEKPSTWWSIGLATGLGLLSKYPAALIPLAPILVIAFQKRWKLLCNWHFIGAMLLALLLFSPVIYWNSQHDWCSFMYQGLQRFGEKKSQTDRVLGSFVNQLLILSPGGMILLIWTLVLSWKKRAELRVQYLLCSSLPLLALLCAVSLNRIVQMNWSLPAYVGAAILMGAAVEERQLFLRRKFIMVLVLLPAFLISFLPLFGVFFPIGALNRANDLKGWKELGKNLGRTMVTMTDPQRTFYLGNAYQILGEIAFYTQRPDIVHGSNLWGEPCKSFDYWDNPEELIGQDAILVTYEELRSNGEWVTRGDFDIEQAKAHFQDFVQHEKFTVFYGGKPLRQYRIYLCHNYKGLQPKESR